MSRIDPCLWDVLGVKAMRLRLLLADGILALSP